MRGGNYKITIKEGKGNKLPNLPFLCTHSHRGTYCGKGLVIKMGSTFTLIDLGEMKDEWLYNSVFTMASLSDLIERADIKPREGEIIIYE